MLRRVFGAETEYALLTRGDGERWLHPDDPAAITAQNVITHVHRLWGREMQANGCRAYADRSHPEWASCEVDNPDDLVAYERAGELCFGEATAALGSQSRSAALFKNSTDGNVTYGSHENYLVPASVAVVEVGRFLAPFLLTRYIWSGAGGVLSVGRDGLPSTFSISQRAPFIHSDVDSQTTHSRPLVNTRDEPLCDPDRFRRLHVLAGESNMMMFPLWMRFAATHLVLRCFEELDDVSAVRGLAPVNVQRSLLAMTYCVKDWSYEAADGRVRAVDVQRTYATMASKLEATGGLCDWERQAITLWCSWLDSLERDPMDLVGVLEWPTKLWWLSDCAERHGFPSAQCRWRDFLWHDIHLSPVRRWESAGRLALPVSLERCREATSDPPSGTRARARGTVVRFARDHRVDAHITWSGASLRLGSARAALSWPDPTDPAWGDDAVLNALLVASVR